jgi:prepilin-type N-terminal cleavage/methylation domain-containing protein
MRRNVLRNTRGFTLIEAMIAMAILLLAVLAMFSVVPFGFSGVLTNSIQVQAVAVGQQYLEDERDAFLHTNPMPMATTAPIYQGQAFMAIGAPAGSYGSFGVSPDGCTTVKSGTPPSISVYSCSVTVSWSQSGASRSVIVQSYVTK